MPIVCFTKVIAGYCTEHITLVTSLLDTVLYTDQALADFYFGRWALVSVVG